MELRKQLNFAWLYSFHSDHLNFFNIFFFSAEAGAWLSMFKAKPLCRACWLQGASGHNSSSLKDTVAPAELKMLWNPHLSSWASLYAPLGLSANTNKGQIPIKNAQGHCNVAKEALWVILQSALCWCVQNWRAKPCRSASFVGLCSLSFSTWLRARLSSSSLSCQLWPCVLVSFPSEGSLCCRSIWSLSRSGSRAQPGQHLRAKVCSHPWQGQLCPRWGAALKVKGICISKARMSAGSLPQASFPRVWRVWAWCWKVICTFLQLPECSLDFTV